MKKAYDMSAREKKLCGLTRRQRQGGMRGGAACLLKHAVFSKSGPDRHQGRLSSHCVLHFEPHGPPKRPRRADRTIRRLFWAVRRCNDCRTPEWQR